MSVTTCMHRGRESVLPSARRTVYVCPLGARERRLRGTWRVCSREHQWACSWWASMWAWTTVEMMVVSKVGRMAAEKAGRRV